MSIDIHPGQWPWLTIPEENWEATGDEDPTSRLSAAIYVKVESELGHVIVPMHIEARAVVTTDDGIQEGEGDWPEDLDLISELAGEGRFMTINIRGREYVLVAYSFCD